MATPVATQGIGSESPIATATSPTATETARPPKTATATATVTATPELIIEIKKIPPEEIPARMEQLTTWLGNLKAEYVASVYPGHPDIPNQGVDLAKDHIGEPLRKAKEALEKGNVEDGRKYLLIVEKDMRSYRFVGDTREGLWIDADVKQAHDPLDKYITNARPSEVWKESMYLQIINILVSTDSEYPQQVRLR